MRKFTCLKIGLIVLSIGAAAACEHVGPMRTESKSVPLGETDSARVRIDIGAGELTVRGGAKELMEGEFATNIRRWMPEVDYHVSGGRGVMRIRQRRHSGIPFGHSKNRWDVRLNNDVPVEMDINMGAGENRVDLRGMDILALDIDMGVGELSLDLSSEQKHDLDVKIDGGIGQATIYLPSDTGVRVRVDGGIGSVNASGLTKSGGAYTNDAYGKGGATLNISIDAGIGSIDLKVR
jgi:hypothetical protein